MPTLQKRVCAVLQPSYLPWLGYFDQIASVDDFVFLDEVQYDKNGWRNRNRVLVQERVTWLTIPVVQCMGQPLNQTIVAPENKWRKKHINTVAQAYAGTRGVAKVLEMLGEVLDEGHRRLVDINIGLTLKFLKALGIGTRIHLSSELGVEGDSTVRLINICRMLGATAYLTGPAAQAYLDVTLFEESSVDVQWHHYCPRVYEQKSTLFVPRLSIVDAACMLDFSGVRSLLVRRNDST